MTRVLVVGANGLLGHTLIREFGVEAEVWGLTRMMPSTSHPLSRWIDHSRWIGGMDADHEEHLATALATSRAEVVVNCAGVIKQRDGGSTEMWRVNARLPHILARLTNDRGARLVHVSTDCVFSGRRGAYCELDDLDADDVYGRSKALGEPTGEHVLTLRSSHIGIELVPGPSLVEWLISQRGRRIDGYRGVRYSGLAVTTTARLIRTIVEDHRRLTGTFHVAATPITKDALLRKLSAALELDVDVVSVDTPTIDRSLDGRAFSARTGLAVPDWDEMIAEIAASVRAYGHRSELTRRR